MVKLLIKYTADFEIKFQADNILEGLYILMNSECPFIYLKNKETNTINGMQCTYIWLQEMGRYDITVSI